MSPQQFPTMSNNVQQWHQCEEERRCHSTKITHRSASLSTTTSTVFGFCRIRDAWPNQSSYPAVWTVQDHTQHHEGRHTKDNQAHRVMNISYQGEDTEEVAKAENAKELTAKNIMPPNCHKSINFNKRGDHLERTIAKRRCGEDTEEVVVKKYVLAFPIEPPDKPTTTWQYIFHPNAPEGSYGNFGVRGHRHIRDRIPWSRPMEAPSAASGIAQRASSRLTL